MGHPLRARRRAGIAHQVERTIQHRWHEELEAWKRMQAKYRLYPD
jgi:hypothetical protein